MAMSTNDDTTFGEKLRAKAGTVLVVASAALLAISAGTTVVSALSDPRTGAEKADDLVIELTDERDAAQDSLDADHEALLDSLPGVDARRIPRDEAAVKGALGFTIETASGSRTLAEAQLVLDARYDALGAGSTTLTDFLPAWYSVAGTETAWTVGEWDVTLSGVDGLTYTYAGTAELLPVSADGQDGAAQWVLLVATTDADGEINAFDVSLADPATRSALNIDDDSLLPSSPASPAAEK